MENLFPKIENIDFKGIKMLLINSFVIKTNYNDKKSFQNKSNNNSTTQKYTINKRKVNIV